MHIFNIGQLYFVAVTSKHIQRAAQTYGVLGRVHGYVKDGWPKDIL